MTAAAPLHAVGARMGGGAPPSVPLALAAGCLALAGAAWWWRSTALREAPADSTPERWEQVREVYPPVADVAPPAIPAASYAADVVRANPFSPLRRASPAAGGPHEASQGGDAASAPAGPAFRYKGRVALGSRQRAVLEDTRSKKTHFLELGQEVAGFKVLDIDEKRVVLSDVKTHEEVVVSVAATEGP